MKITRRQLRRLITEMIQGGELPPAGMIGSAGDSVEGFIDGINLFKQGGEVLNKCMQSDRAFSKFIRLVEKEIGPLFTNNYNFERGDDDDEEETVSTGWALPLIDLLKIKTNPAKGAGVVTEEALTLIRELPSNKKHELKKLLIGSYNLTFSCIMEFATVLIPKKMIEFLLPNELMSEMSINRSIIISRFIKHVVDSNDCSPECAVFLGNLVNLGLIADALDVYDPSEYIDKQGYKIY